LPPEINEDSAAFAGVGTRVLRCAGDGPPFVFLHGYSDSADTWRPLLRELHGRGRSAIAVDLPGFGRADRAEPGPLLPQIDRFVGALLREASETGPAILCGNSLGGVACLRAAQDRELPLAGVVPVAPAGFGHQPWVEAIERVPIATLVLSGVPTPPWLIRPLVGLAYRSLAVGQRRLLDPDAVRAYASHVTGRDWVRRIVSGARPLLAEIRAAYELERICRPVLLVWGTRDRLVPARGARRLLDAVPGARLELLDGAGHCPQLEEPARLCGLLLEFDARARAAAPEKIGELT
jgi:pimeloyl-ACP methyl ester carboxylesterase